MDYSLLMGIEKINNSTDSSINTEKLFMIAGNTARETAMISFAYHDSFIGLN